MDQVPHRFIFLRRFLRSEEHTSELQSRFDLVCRLLLEKKKSRHRRHAGIPRSETSPVLPRNRAAGILNKSMTSVAVCISGSREKSRQTYGERLTDYRDWIIPKVRRPATRGMIKRQRLPKAGETAMDSSAQWLVPVLMLFFFNHTAPADIYTLSLHDALPI